MRRTARWFRLYYHKINTRIKSVLIYKNNYNNMIAVYNK